MYSAQDMGAALARRRRGVGELNLTFPFLSDCAVGATDPATGDTIAGCATAAAPPVVTQSVTVTAKAYPTWLYAAAGLLGGVILLKAFRGR